MGYTVLCMAYTVTAAGVRKAFGRQVVLDGVDLRVETATVVALLGPNGAGKTTMVRILAGLVRPDAGTVVVAGHDLGDDVRGVKESISLTGQFAAVDEVLTGRENLEMMAALRRLDKRPAHDRVEELLVEFDLVDAADRRVSTYSGGMTRRLDLAISMITPPAVLFLDEPTNGLDPRSRERLWGTVRGLVDAGTTILLTTQYLEEADQLADRVAVLDGGRIVAEGTAAELKSSLSAETVRLEFDDVRSFDAALTELGEVRADPRLRAVEVPGDGTPANLVGLLDRLERRGCPPRRVSTRQPSLDDVFLTLTAPAPLTPEESLS
jgi:ABC-2 type transport system ATP-binding protein